MSLKSFLLLLVLMQSILSAETITIAVAANVSYAMDDLKKAFVKTAPETEVRVILGGSGKLTAQISNGAPYGLFMSANMAYPEALYKAKVATTKPVVYAKGALAYLSVKPQDFFKGAKLLTSEKIRRIAIANPKTAPYGLAAVEALKHAGVYEAVKSKFVYGESVSQTVSYATTAADIGIVAKSALYSANMAQYKEGIHWKALEPKLYSPIKQGMVLLKAGEKNPSYRAFYDFMLSKPAQDILKQYGYLLP